MLSLRLLGPFQAWLDEVPLTQFESNKVRALLAFLGTEWGQVQQRSHLAALLWPNLPEAKALANLRHALANLRRMLGDAHATSPFILTTRYTVQLNPDAPVRIDVVAFREHVAAMRRGQDPFIHGRAAVALYQDAFLLGLRVRKSPPWDEWCTLMRETLAWEFQQGLQALVRALEQAGERRDAIHYARLLVQQDPWNEEAQRQLIRLLALDGQRSAALAQFARCRQVLQDALGVEPEPETVALAQAIRNGQYPPPIPERQPAISRALPHHTKFVARQAELAQLMAFRQRMLQGRSQMVFITGEAGSGKTALAAAFGREILAHHQDMVAWGACNAFAGRGDPFLPFRDILLALIGEPNALRLGDIMGEGYRRRLQRFIPTIAPILMTYGPDIIEALDLRDTLIRQMEAFMPTGMRKQQLLAQGHQPSEKQASLSASEAQRFAQYTQVLRQAARRVPLVLVLGDLHWADAGSLSLLFHLGHRLQQEPILILGLFRQEDVLQRPTGAQPHPLTLILREFQRRQGDILIDLDRIPGRAFVNAYLDSEPNDLSTEFRDKLYAHTGGHALFTAELLASLQEKGYLVQQAGRWVIGSDLPWDEIPPRVEAIIAERIAQLGSSARTLLTAASVAVDDFSAEALALMLAWPLTQVHEVLEALAAPPWRLLVFRGRSWAHAQRLHIYRFRHVLFQTHLYQQMGEGERRRWHERMGLALEQLFSNRKTTLAPALTHHFEKADMPMKAAYYALKAGEQAMMLFAPEEAMAMYSRGLALLQHVPPSQARSELEMALQLAISTPLLVIQGWGAKERARASQRAYELCQQTGDEHALIHALFLQADMRRAVGQYRDSLELAEQLKDLAEKTGDRNGLALAHWALGETYLFQGQVPRARSHLQLALTHDAQVEDDMTLLTSTDLAVVSHVWLAWIEALSGHAQAADTHLTMALTRSQEIHHPLSRSFALFLGVYGLAWLRHAPQVSRELVEEANALMQEEGLAGMRPWGDVFQGWVLAQSGALEEGIGRMERGMVTWQKMGAVSGLTCQALPLARALLQAGRWDEAGKLVLEMKGLMESTGERLFEEAWQALARQVADLAGETKGVD